MWLLNAALVLIALASPASTQQATLRLLTNYQTTLGARCLDGSAPAYYYIPGSGANVNNWMLFIEGGGWCYTSEECYERSLTSLGSSSSYNASTDVPLDGMSGLWSFDCIANPVFCTWTKIFMKYCDGTSFTSYLNNSVNYDGHNLYFRGRANLDAMLADLPNLSIGSGWNTAGQVVLSGCSAGGLSTYHAADHVAMKLPKSVKKYAAIPVSGYFLLTNNAQNQPVYPMQMASIFALGNCSYGVSQSCLSANPGASAWKCLFAQNALPYIKTPIFILNSAFDAWQLLCEFYANATTCGATWTGCMPSCTTQQWTALNGYGANFVSILNATSNYHRSGNGGFIHSCITHCEAVSGAWDSFTINHTSMAAAVAQWWQSNFTGNNWYWDCMMYTTNSPHYCNPTCGTFPRPEEAVDRASAEYM